MSHILSLISNPQNPQVGEDLVRAIESRVKDMGRRPSAVKWLADGIACEWQITCPPEDVLATLSALRSSLKTEAVDINILPDTERRKKLLLADMDSTMIEQECLDEIAAFAGVKDRVSEITARAMAGELNFESALRERVTLLDGMSADVLDKVIRDHITLAAGAQTLVRTMREAGAITILVSGGFTFFTQRIADACGFEHNLGNTLNIQDGKLTGTVAEPILGKEAKHATLLRFTKEKGLLLLQTMAVGDGANDKDMIVASGLGVAIHAKPILRDVADAAIDHGDLTALLYLQGYQQTEFIN